MFRSLLSWQDLPPGPVANGGALLYLISPSMFLPGHTPVPKARCTALRGEAQDPADLLRFAQSERFQRLRQEVVNNPKALEFPGGSDLGAA